MRGNHTAALALGEQFLTVAHRQQDATLSLVAHAVLGETLLWRGEFTLAQVHLDQAWLSTTLSTTVTWPTI